MSQADKMPMPTLEQSVHVMRCHVKTGNCDICNQVFAIWDQQKEFKRARKKAERKASEVPHE